MGVRFVLVYVLVATNFKRKMKGATPQLALAGTALWILRPALTVN